jgi:hypothetical protein
MIQKIRIYLPWLEHLFNPTIYKNQLSKIKSLPISSFIKKITSNQGYFDLTIIQCKGYFEVEDIKPYHISILFLVFRTIKIYIIILKINSDVDNID